MADQPMTVRQRISKALFGKKDDEDSSSVQVPPTPLQAPSKPDTTDDPTNPKVQQANPMNIQTVTEIMKKRKKDLQSVPSD